jgi:uncharacterized protein YndB with AHSA1/START domain
MTVTRVGKDLENLAITWIADFDASFESIWRLWSDPRLLERWLGPPTYPATVSAFDLSPGGEATYALTGPGGETFTGKWTFVSVIPATSLEYVDGDPNSGEGMPVVNWNMHLFENEGRTRMEVRSRFSSLEDMNTMIEMGTLEGHAATIGQMDALLEQLESGSPHTSPEVGRI